MNAVFEEKLQKEIRKRAFRRWDQMQHEKQQRQDIQHNLDALYEVTGLPRSELEAIAEEVRLSRMCYDENFFSIKNQILVTCGIFSFVIILGWLFLSAFNKPVLEAISRHL